MWVLLWPQNVTSHFFVVKSSCDVNLWFHCDITVSWNITPWVQKKWLLTMLTLPWPQNVTSHFFTVKSSCDLTMWFHCDITVSWNITPWVKKSGYSSMLIPPWPQNVTSHFFTVKSSCDLTMWFHCDITVSWNITPWVKKKWLLINANSTMTSKCNLTFLHSEVIQWSHHVISLWHHCELKHHTASPKKLHHDLKM